MANEVADELHLFVCCACGKTSTTRYGFDEAGKSTASPGWDESCMMNARLFLKTRLVWSEHKTRVLYVKAETPEAPSQGASDLVD